MANKLRDRVTKNLTPQSTDQAQQPYKLNVSPRQPQVVPTAGRSVPSQVSSTDGQQPFKLQTQLPQGEQPFKLAPSQQPQYDQTTYIPDSNSRVQNIIKPVTNLRSEGQGAIGLDVPYEGSSMTQGVQPQGVQPQGGGGGGAWNNADFDIYNNQFINGAKPDTYDYTFGQDLDKILANANPDAMAKAQMDGIGTDTKKPNVDSTYKYNQAMINNYRNRGVPDSDIQNIMSGIMREQSIRVESSVLELKEFINEVVADDKGDSGAKILDKYLGEITSILDQNKQDLEDRRDNALDDPALNSMMGILNDEFSEMRKALHSRLRMQGLNRSGMGTQAHIHLSGKKLKAQQQMISQFVSQVNSEVHQGLLALSGQRVAMMSQFAGLEVNVAENMANRNLQKMQLKGNSLGEINKLYSDLETTKLDTATKVEDFNLRREALKDDREYKSAMLDLDAQRLKLQEVSNKTDKEMLQIEKDLLQIKYNTQVWELGEAKAQKGILNEKSMMDQFRDKLTMTKGLEAKLNSEKGFADALQELEPFLWYEDSNGKMQPTEHRRLVIDPLYKKYYTKKGTGSNYVTPKSIAGRAIGGLAKHQARGMAKTGMEILNTYDDITGTARRLVP